MARPAPSDDGNLARLIATMVGIVGIVLLGSLAWSAVGAMFSALGEATSVLSNSRPTPTKLAVAVSTATPQPTTTPPPDAQPTKAPVLTPMAAPSQAPTPGATAALTPQPTTPTSAASGRAPWILLPQPAPGTHVPTGPLVVEARGRGDAPISAIHLELDGAALAVSFEQRSESTWRGAASTSVPPGHHAVRATVQDQQGRTGSYRWTFEAGP